MSEFTYELDSRKQGASYTFSFIEDCSHTTANKKFMFSYAFGSENAFDITYRCGVAVDDIMRLNNIKTPFDITEGERLRLYENCYD
ncbi:MAG: LysM peptidoglycan-binding domain-containing protein [Clostridiales bacterium]|nr:LysM peptidoglycan-binding domain-containing protein [Clostridiales bacterium]